ncbi:MAG: SAM-dependent methyltransferase, partial [Sphingomonadaceae bacterium]|nr:SAM-dependent methyltransferase [Sphingomonadaceae bacterium]
FAQVAQKAGLKIELLNHFNSLLFPVAAVARIIGKAMGKKTSDDQMPSPAINRILTGIFGFERHLVGHVPMPAGVSLVAILS